MKLPHVRQVRTARGRKVYTYFQTGTRDAAGKPIMSPLPNPTDAGFAAAYAAAMSLRTRRTAVKATGLTFPDLVRLYELSHHFRTKLAENSRRIYSTALGKLSVIYRDAPAASLTQVDVQELVDATADRPGVANNYCLAVGALYAWGKRRGHVTLNPAQGVETFETTPIPAWPLEALRLALESDDERVKLATALLYYTGQRVGDIVRLRWTDIEAGILRVTQEKTGKAVIVPVHRDLAAILAATPRRALTILTSATGVKPATRGAVRRWLIAALPDTFKVTTHGLRKNAVIALLEAGCTVAEIAAITRQSLAMIEHYARDIDQLKMASAAILKFEAKR